MIKIINKMKDKDIVKPRFKPGHIYMTRNGDYSPNKYYFCGEHETEGIFMVNLANGIMNSLCLFENTKTVIDITDKVSFYVPLVQKDPTYDCTSDTPFSLMDEEETFMDNATYMDGNDVFLVVRKTNGEKYRAYISGDTIKDLRYLFSVYRCNLEMAIRDEEDA